jgi:hypothetical protein
MIICFIGNKFQVRLSFFITERQQDDLEPTHQPPEATNPTNLNQKKKGHLKEALHPKK